MKTLFRLLLAAGIGACLALSCSKYDDTELRNSLTKLSVRVTELENWKKSAQDNIQSLLTLTQGLDKNWFISAVNELGDGYEIVFANGKKATIKNGADGHSPVIGVKAASDGKYYWTLDGEWLFDTDGNKLPVCGKDGVDGVDGVDGEDGEDGVTPLLKIEEDYWYVSTDNGETWTKLGKATGESGAAGDAMFKEVTFDDNFVYFTLADGTELKISRGANGVQAIVAAPSFTDGSVAAVPGDFDIAFKVIPASATASLKVLDAKCFSLEIAYTATKASAGEWIKLPVGGAKVYEDEGILFLTVDGSVLGPEFNSYLLGASGILTIDDGVKAVTSGFFSLCNVNKINGHDFVEMGDGLKWATCNLGATRPEDFGYFLAWAETAPKDNYGWETYEWTSGPDWTSIFKYTIEDGQPSGSWYYGSTFYGDDGDGVGHWTFAEYDFEDDAARQNWHGTWRTPTPNDWYHLTDSSHFDWAWTDNYAGTGVSGWIVTSLVAGYEGNMIFLPAAGYMIDSMHYYPGDIGTYWSSSVSDSYTDYSYYLYFENDNFSMESDRRCLGFSVRPVSD